MAADEANSLSCIRHVLRQAQWNAPPEAEADPLAAATPHWARHADADLEPPARALHTLLSYAEVLPGHATALADGYHPCLDAVQELPAALAAWHRGTQSAHDALVAILRTSTALKRLCLQEVVHFRSDKAWANRALAAAGL